MTPELEQRWRAAHAPFDGRAIVTCDDPDLGALRQMLLHACQSLEPLFSDVSQFPDWHEHDGYLTSETPLAWSNLIGSLRDTHSLYDSRDGDDLVRIAVFPASFEWLLRYSIDDAASGEWSEAWCSLDFSCTPNSVANNLIDSMKARWPGYCDIMLAKEYFDNARAA